MSNFYIRPRQDFSLSRMADAMSCLVLWDFCPVMRVYNDKKKPTLIISIESFGVKKELCEKAIAVLVNQEHFVKDNFKIIELSPATILMEVH